MAFYVTTPIYYVNAEPHLGHAYTTVVADVVARFKRLKGEEVFFLTGTDEHGDKIVKAAKAQGLTPKEYVDRISQKFRETWPILHINYSRFIRTTEPYHQKVVQLVLQKLYDQGDISFGEYEGLYCFGCERFLTEKELEDGKCPDHKIPPTPLKESNYFFDLSKYQDWLRDYLKANPDLIQPPHYREEVLGLLRDPLDRLCISRPKSRLSWGIEFPFDSEYVTYVWFDALLNYLSGIGYPEDPNWQKWWASAEHIIAKDILKPHALYWPIMLRAIGLPIFKRLHVHGYWNLNQAKMSKSLGNVVRPDDLVARYGADQVRYFLLREMAFGYDAEFSEEALIRRLNAELANDFGNLVYRTLTMVKKYFGGEVPEPGEEVPEDRALRETILSAVKTYDREMEGFRFHRALGALSEAVGAANQYIDRQAPWQLNKEGRKERLARVLYTLLEALRVLSVAFSPVMPKASEKILINLGLSPEEELRFERALSWGLLAPGGKTQRGKVLFPRLEMPDFKAESEKTKEETTVEDKTYPIEEFKKWDLRVAEVVAAERVPGTDRLLKLTVKCPEERTVVAGIAEYYPPETLVGKKIVLVANLKPAKIRGVVSQGMVLAAKDAQGLKLIVPEGEIACGAEVG
ncbi:methionine--tRNA ligase [Thermosulfurimonas dismutans]|uniref:Methionine--tRNA ligase n=1 Tax=Thermosulfurimonas dismutans TaxID=999894 RepID=A0A179D6N4_9BACT|nr:methionine--tRNA ligase [Thermosulfurimonas dismutans]OAQ21623.1 Methionyl-tRNA synthetase [Thermosulfurimonas dismutans]